MRRQSLLYVTLSLCAYFTTNNGSELFLVEETKMLDNNEILSVRKAEVNGEETILIDTKIETPQSGENGLDPRFESESSAVDNEKLSKTHGNLLDGSVSKSYQNEDPLFESKSSGISKENLPKPISNLSNGSEEYTVQNTTTDSSAIENKSWKDTTTEVVESDIINTTSDFYTSTSSVDFDENLRPLNYVFKPTLKTEQSNVDITTDATTEGDIEFTQIANKSPSNANLKLVEAADIQLRGLVEIPTESVETLGFKVTNDDIISTTENSMKTENGFPITEFSTDRTEIDTKWKPNATTDIGSMEDRDIEYSTTSGFSEPGDLTNQSTESALRKLTSGGPSDSSDPEDLTIQSTDSATWNITTDLDKVHTKNFTSLDPSKAVTTSQRSMELTTESIFSANISEEINTPSSTILGTTENTNFVEGMATVNKIEFETPSANGKKYRDSETSRIRNSIKDAEIETGTELKNSLPTSNNKVVFETKTDKPEVNPTQTTTFRTRELNSHGTAAPTKIRSPTPSKPKQTHTPSAWYTNLIPLYPIYLLNPLNYFYNSTNQTFSGGSALPTAWNYTSLFNPPAFNWTNLLSQILLPGVATTARHGFFQQTQTNLTNFQFFPFLRLFNKTKFATNTQTATTVNASDVLTALLQLKNGKFQQLQTVQTNANANANNALFVSRQWYTPYVSDNLERSEEVPFLTPVVRYSNNDRSYYRSQGQPLLTPFITYVERGEPYRVERPHYYRERPKLVKRPTTYYREQPYYAERPYDIERPYQVEHPSYYNHPVKPVVNVQSGPISYESSPTMDLSYMEPIIDVDAGDVDYYYRNKKLNATTSKSAVDSPKAATTSLMVEVEVPNPLYKFMQSIYNLFMPNN